MHEREPIVKSVVAAGTHVPPALVPRSVLQTVLPCKRLSSNSLLAGMNEIEIEHGASIYRLRITSLGKLILTK